MQCLVCDCVIMFSNMICITFSMTIFFFKKKIGVMDFYTPFLIDNEKYDGEVSLNNRADFYSYESSLNDRIIKRTDLFIILNHTVT
jgi:hypothetical protein